MTKMAAPMSKTNSQQNPSKIRPSPEVIVFNDPDNRKKHIKSKQKTPTELDKQKEEEYLEKKHSQGLRKAKFDVRKFGITGFSKEAKEEAKMKLAIELGAKPPKRNAENYKVLMSKLKVAREVEKKKRENDRYFGIVKKPMGKKKPRKRGSGFKCQVGKYKDGVQTIPNRIIKQTNRN